MLTRTLARNLPLISKQTISNSTSSLPSFLLPFQFNSFHSTPSSYYPPASTSKASTSTSNSSTSNSSSSHITPSEAESKRIEEINTLPPPPLSRPLGVDKFPTTRSKTTAEWKADLLNQTKRLTERKHLLV